MLAKNRTKEGDNIMVTNFEYAIKNLLADEGGYVNDPADPGGETKFGISKRAYPNEDIKNLTEVRAREIYRRDYWNKLNGDAILSPEKASAVLSACVNFGVANGVKLAQKAAGVPRDGEMGGQSVRRVNDMDLDTFLARFAIAMIERYTRICRGNPSQIKYFLGWVNRALRVSGMVAQ